MNTQRTVISVRSIVEKQLYQCFRCHIVSRYLDEAGKGPTRERSLLGWQLEPKDISNSTRHPCCGDLKFSWFNRGA